MSVHPVLMHTALDATDCRGLAEFYRQFLGLGIGPATKSRCIRTLRACRGVGRCVDLSW